MKVYNCQTSRHWHLHGHRHCWKCGD